MTDYRNAIYVEDAEVLARDDAPDGQCILRLATPQCANEAQPGQFIHIQCHATLPMRRPYSIMTADREAGWIEILFGVTGVGSNFLSQCEVGTYVSCLGPIGKPLTPTRTWPLLLGGGVGVPPMLFFARTLSMDDTISPRVILASERKFPFEVRRSTDDFDGVPKRANLSLACLSAWGVPSRLASRQGFEGCYNGYLHELAATWLAARTPDELKRVEIFACGPAVMLRAAATVAGRYDLPCHLMVEEYMACGVGGCAGCVIPTYRDGKRIMRRVCVDGPVFDAAEIYPECFTWVRAK